MDTRRLGQHPCLAGEGRPPVGQCGAAAHLHSVWAPLNAEERRLCVMVALVWQVAWARGLLLAAARSPCGRAPTVAVATSAH